MANRVFVLMHAHELTPDLEDIKLIGVYSTEVKAYSALKRAESLQGFSDTREGFHVQAYELDKDHWLEGFVTQLPRARPAKVGLGTKSRSRGSVARKTRERQ
jgi:hypothetical protein